MKIIRLNQMQTEWEQADLHYIRERRKIAEGIMVNFLGGLMRNGMVWRSVESGKRIEILDQENNFVRLV